MAVLTKTPDSPQQAESKPTYDASITFAGSDTVIADQIVITGRFRDPIELRNWIIASTLRLVENIEKERGENNGH